MDLVREQRIMQLLEAAMDVPDAHRALFLDKQCGDDLDLRQQVMSRLAISCGGLDFIEKGLYDEDLTPGSFVGPFRIVRSLGEGGMGSVFLAQQDYPISRSVSLKVLKKGLNGAELQQRFHHERQILANLQHPYIAQLIDADETEDHRPYFTMEYVQGTSIVEYCRQSRLSLYQRIELFRKVCEAVACAHEHGIIHRDIKPGNILVTDRGTPKLLDFGIAKHSEAPYGMETATDSRCRFMTPDYASPEQANCERVTQASDIYSLGVLLFELLTERRPYYFENRQPISMCKVICEQEPPIPSRVVRGDFAEETDARFSPRERRANYRTLKGDLDSIVLKMLRKKPEERYHHVKALIEDLNNFTTGRPVVARRQQRFYKIQKMWQTNRQHVARFGLTAAMMAGSGMAILQYAQKNIRLQQRPGQVHTTPTGFLSAFTHLLWGYPTQTDTPSVAAEAWQVGEHRAQQEQYPLGRFMMPPSNAVAADGLHAEPKQTQRNHPRDAKQHLPLTRQKTDTRQQQPRHTNHQAAAETTPAPTRDRSAQPSPVYSAFPAENAATPQDFEAWSLANQGRYDEAEALYRDALDDAVKDRGERDPKVADVYMGLAEVLSKKGLVYESENALRAALDIRDFNNETQSLVATLDSLASNLEQQKRYEESDPLRWRALNRRYEYHGGDPEKLLPTMQALATTYETQGRLTRSVQIYKHMLDLPKNHQAKTVSLQAKASIYDGLARVHDKMYAYDKAEQYYREAMSLRLSSLGKGDRATIASVARLANLYQRQDRVAEAENLYRRALDWQAAADARDQTSSVALDGLTGLLDSQGRSDEAEAIKDRHPQISDEHQEPEHPEVVHWRQDLESQQDDGINPDVGTNPGVNLDGSNAANGAETAPQSGGSDGGLVQNTSGDDNP